jgi:hypothetical protein
MTLNINKSPQSVEFIGTSGRVCASYDYEDTFKSFFRGLYTRSGKDVLARWEALDASPEQPATFGRPILTRLLRGFS